MSLLDDYRTDPRYVPLSANPRVGLCPDRDSKEHVNFVWVVLDGNPVSDEYSEESAIGLAGAFANWLNSEVTP